MPETELNIQEKGALVNGAPQLSSKRLYMQLQVFGNCQNPQLIQQAFQTSGLEGAIYLDVNDPYGIGILMLTEREEDLSGKIRDFFHQPVFKGLLLKTEMSMLGRSYSTGHEPQLEDWLLQHPRRRVLNAKWPWAIWYPLRRRGDFEKLSREEQGRILMDHAAVGKSFGQAGYAFDVRLVCYGLHQKDQDFLIGLVGPELFPLSRIIQDMRKTIQTSTYLESLGPFFVGKTFWQSPLSK